MATEALHPPHQSNLAGIGLRLGATVAFGLMAALIKLAHDAGANTAEMVFFRNLFGMPVILAWIVWTGTLDAWRTSRPWAHLTRGTLGLASMALAFGALALLPLAEATTISFVAPLFAVALSALILKEEVRRHRWTAVGVGFVGVVVVMQPAGSGLAPVGLTLAILAAIGVAGVTIAIRQIGQTESTQTTVLWFTGFSLLVSSLFMPFFAQGHDPYVWVTLLALGLCGGVGQLFLTASLRAAPIAVVVPFDYASLIWAVLLGWLIWDTHPQATTWIGAAIIVGSGLYTVYREHKLGRDKPRPEPL